MPLKDLPADAQPREKLLARGAGALSDTELLALLLRTGTRRHGVLRMAQHVLQRFDGLGGLLHAKPEELKDVHGLGGPAKRAEIVAVMELAKRALAQQLREKPVFDAPGTVRDYMQAQLAHRAHEVFAVMFLDAHGRLLAFEELFAGTLTETSVYPREIVLRALHLRASAVVLCHNHPVGRAQPSRADVVLTERLEAALGLVDIRVLDHVIVARGEAASMKDGGHF